MGEEVGDQRKAFVRRVRTRGQPEIHERELRGFLQLPHQVYGMPARLAGMYLEVGAERK